MQPDWEIWLDNQLSSSLAKIIKLNTGNMPTALLWKKYSKNFTSAIKLLQKTKAEIIFIE